MKSALFVPLVAAVAAAASPAFAQQENARVISSTPVIQQVAVPQQVCSQQQVVTRAPSSGAGAAMGAIAGGAMGNAIGNGGGRAAATVLGLIGGAMLGDRVEGSSNQLQNVTQCATQTTYENRTVGYNVVYEYAGRQYSTQMQNDPGSYLPIQVSPSSGATGMAVPPVQSSGGPVYSTPVQPTYVQPAVVQPGVVVSSVPVAPVVYAAPSYYAAPYYPAPYYARPAYGYGYPPVGVSLNFGYSRGGHGHWR